MHQMLPQTSPRWCNYPLQISKTGSWWRCHWNYWTLLLYLSEPQLRQFLGKIIIANVCQCFPYNIQQFPNVLQSILWSKMNKTSMLTFWSQQQLDIVQPCKGYPFKMRSNLHFINKSSIIWSAASVPQQHQCMSSISSISATVASVHQQHQWISSISCIRASAVSVHQQR